MDIKDHIQKKLKEILVSFQIDQAPVVKITDDASRGDYYSNVAMQYWNQESRSKNQEWKSPLEFAEKLVNSMIHDSEFMIHFYKVEAVAPGFINFWVSDQYLFYNLITIDAKKDEYGKGSTLSGKKVIVEYTDPNPLKEFHIGHLYSNAVGESLSRLFEFQDAKVFRVCYQGDVGLHVAKALYGIFKKLDEEQLTIDDLAGKPLIDRARFLGESYAIGAKAYEENEGTKNEIIELNKKVYDKDPSIYLIYEKAKDWSLEYFETIYQKLGTKFDHYYFESNAGKKGLEIVKENMGKVFVEDSGAVIFPKEKSGLHTRVFINSQGLPTYEAKELGLATIKFDDFSYDTSVVITGNEVNEYFKVLLKALSLINPALSEKTKHISHGMVRLPSGKMSSRTGDVITGDSLIFETESRISQSYREVEKESLSKIAVAAIKYALLKSNVGHDVTFNFEESINLNGNSGPYIQYTYVRTKSVLNKYESASRRTKSETNSKLETQKFNPNEEEKSVLRLLSKFEEIVLESGQKYSPNLVCSYLFEICSSFNLFYQKHPILEAKEGPEVVEFRLLLTLSTGQVIKNGLNILGIDTVEKM